MGKMTGKKSYGKIDHFPVIFTGGFQPYGEGSFFPSFLPGDFFQWEIHFPVISAPGIFCTNPPVAYGENDGKS